MPVGGDNGVLEYLQRQGAHQRGRQQPLQFSAGQRVLVRILVRRRRELVLGLGLGDASRDRGRRARLRLVKSFRPEVCGVRQRVARPIRLAVGAVVTVVVAARPQHDLDEFATVR